MTQAARLERIDTDLWLVEGPVVSFYGFAYPTRSVIVRLPDGALWIWSPIPLDDALAEEVVRLGPVAHLVSPNKLHHLGLDDWHVAFPEARLWGPPATLRKRGDLPFAEPLGDTPPAAWQGIVEQVWVRGSPLLDEVEFFHRPSQTALVADLCQTFEATFLEQHWAPWQRVIARLWGITAGRGRAPLEIRLTTVRRRTARAAIRRLIDYAPQRVIMAHGSWQRRDGQAFLQRAFSWLGV
ncbi:DUF4336 domain-containing protein [Halomonas sp. THAF12]|uniref:DUF4336 domain-containing protein n=1 Tax=Halomonas sp. B23F22_10 TaxID=3459515 RepID=UPI00373E2766